MKYLTLLLILSSVFFLHFTYKNRSFVYEVSATNGGPEGFNEVSNKCNTGLNTFISTYNGAGYEKPAITCKNDLPNTAIEAIEKCGQLVSLDKDTMGSFIHENLLVEFKIKNKVNFSYSIKSK